MRRNIAIGVKIARKIMGNFETLKFEKLNKFAQVTTLTYLKKYDYHYRDNYVTKQYNLTFSL